MKTTSRYSLLFKNISFYLGLAVLAGGSAVITGWIFGIPFLQSILPNYVTMKMNGAICFALLGLTIVLFHKTSLLGKLNEKAAYACVFIAFSISFLTFIEYITGLNLGIDQIFINDNTSAILTSQPGRIAFNTTFNFILISISIFGIRSGKKIFVYLTQSIVLFSALSALLALTGYFYQAHPLILDLRFSTAMAIHTSILFLALCISYLFARPELGLIRIITNDSASGKLARMMLPIAIIVPLLTGWLRILAVKSGIVNAEMGVALVAVINLTVTSVYICIIAFFANISEERREEAEKLVKEKNAIFQGVLESTEAEIFSLDRDYKYTSFNKTHAAGMKAHYNSDIKIGMPFYEAQNINEEWEKSKLNIDHSLAGERLTLNIFSGGEHLQRIYLDISQSPIFDTDGTVIGVSVLAQDVTERGKAEQLVRESEEKYRALIETTNTGFLVLDKEGRVTDANAEYVRLTGRNKLSEILGKTVIEWTADYEQEKNSKALAQCLSIGFIKNLEIDYISGNGEITPVEISATVIGSGKSMKILSLCRDITARKQAEFQKAAALEALQKSETQLSNAASIAKLGSWEYNRSSDLFTFSDSFYNIFRTTAKEVGGYTMSSADYSKRFVHPEDAPTVAREIRKSIEDNTASPNMQIEHRIIYSDGHVGYISVRVVVVKDEHGRPLRSYGVNQDITERRNAERTLRESEEKFRNYIDSAPDGIFTADNTGKYIDVNKTACLMTGYSREELLNMSITDILAEDSAQDGIAHFKQLTETGRAVNDIWLKRKDGSKICVTIDAVKLSETRFLAFCKDITKNKQAQLAVRVSEEKFRNYIENAPVGIFVLDSNGHFIEANRSACRIVGFPLKELKELSIDQVLAEESREAGRDHFRLLMEKGTATSGPLWHKHKDGSKRCLVIEAVKLSNGSMFGFGTDITEKQLSEDRLLESEKKYRRLVETLHEGIWTIDANATTTFANPCMAEMLGYTVEEILGKPMVYFVDNKSKVTVNEKLINREKGISEQYETVFNKKNGEHLHVLISAVPIIDEKGIYFGSQGSIQDITQRKQSERAVRFQTALEKGLSDISREITSNTNFSISEIMNIISTVFSFDKGYMYLTKIEDEDANNLSECSECFPENAPINSIYRKKISETGLIHAYIQRFGYVENPLVINNAEEDNSHLLPEEKQLFKTLGIKATLVMPVYHRRPLQKNLIALIGFECYENTKIWERPEVKFIQAVGEIYAIDYERKYSMNELQKAHDELEEKVKERTKNLQEANEKLKELDKIKSEFLSTMSHEFRTPLTSIKAFTEILLKNPGENKKQRTEFLEIISAENERLTRLIDDFLDLSKIESGRIEWNMEKISITKLFDNAVECINQVAKKKKITLKIQIEPGLPLVTADRDRMLQVVMNLLSNAVKFMPDNGNIRIGARTKEGLMEAYVSDSGIGIAPEYIEAVFERFKQITYVQSGKPKGTGLGLAICKEIIEYHKGKIWVESPPRPGDGQEGKGSAFYFTIPFEQPVKALDQEIIL